MGDGGHSKGGRSKVLINFGCQNVARGLDFARFGVRKGDPSGPVRRKSYDFALRVALWIQKRVNVGMCFGKRVHVRSDPSPTPLLFGVGGSGRRPVNPPTPRPRGPAWGSFATPVIENLVYEKFSKEGYYRVLLQGAGVLKGFK